MADVEPPIHADHMYQAAWRQPEDVDRFIRENCTGFTLNVCAGESPIGDVKIDADPQRPEVIPADMNHLPFPEATFDSVIFDPPWKMEYLDRMTPFFECERVLKPDGLLLMNARWVGESDHTTIDGDLIVRADDRWSNVSVLVPHRKQPGQQTLGT